MTTDEQAQAELNIMLSAIVRDFSNGEAFELGKFGAKKKLANGYVVTFEIKQGKL